jgi:arsenate reductase
MSVTLYHNPRCSKSREALRLLRERGVEPVIVHYLETPPDAATIEKLLDALGMQPRELMRRKEEEYRAAGLDDPRLGRADLIRAMVEHPRLIERPIAVSGGKVALGRPPEKVLEVL